MSWGMYTGTGRPTVGIRATWMIHSHTHTTLSFSLKKYVLTNDSYKCSTVLKNRGNTGEVRL